MAVETFVIRLATEADTPTVVTIWTGAAAWLRTLGTDQWQYPIKMYNIHAEIGSRSCWIVESSPGTPVGIVTVDPEADPTLWQPDDQPNNALYLHRLAVRDDLRGRELGSSILDWAGRRAQSAGKPWIRLDAWTSNPGLHQYYLNRGFRLVRMVTGLDIGSGTLFERSADYQTSDNPIRIVETPNSPGRRETVPQPPPRAPIGANLVRLRRNHALTQEGLAEKAGVSVDLIKKLEQGAD
jgi:GNAT superfamily N-acetyltransferase